MSSVFGNSPRPEKNKAVARNYLSSHHDGTDDESTWRQMNELALLFDNNLSDNVFLEDEDKDEDVDDLDFKLATISREFCHLGIIPYHASGSIALDFKNLVSATYALINNYHHLVAINKESTDRQVKALDDFSSLQQAHTRLKDTLEQGERTIAGLQESIRVLRKQNSTLSSKTKLDKDEIRRLNSAMQAREVQYRNDVRKREHQIEKLKDRISQLLTNKTALRFPEIQISSNIPRKDGARAKWNIGICSAIENQMQRDVNNMYEARFLAISQENNEIRENLLYFHKKLKELGKRITTTNTSLENSSPKFENFNVEAVSKSDLDELQDGHFHMPFAVTTKLINANIESMLSRITNLLPVDERNS